MVWMAVVVDACSADDDDEDADEDADGGERSSIRWVTFRNSAVFWTPSSLLLALMVLRVTVAMGISYRYSVCMQAAVASCLRLCLVSMVNGRRHMVLHSTNIQFIN